MIEAVNSRVEPVRGAGKRRLSKAAQQRIKVGLVALSVAAFGGALGGIIAINPAVQGTSPAGAQAAANFVLPPEPVAPQISSAPLVLPSSAQVPAFRPRTRTRGS